MVPLISVSLNFEFWSSSIGEDVIFLPTTGNIPRNKNLHHRRSHFEQMSPLRRNARLIMAPSISESLSDISIFEDYEDDVDDDHRRARVPRVELQQLNPSTPRPKPGQINDTRKPRANGDNDRFAHILCRKRLCPKLRNGGYGPPPILFRAWSENSGGFNSILKFEAGDTLLFDRHTMADLRRNDALLLKSIAANHINGLCNFGTGAGSPLISTSPSLVWVVHKMFKEQTIRRKKDRTDPDIHIAILDGKTATDATPWWYAYDLRNKDWPWSYHGSHEFLLATKIEESAFLGPSVSLRSLKALCSLSPDVSSLLQIDIISKRTMGQILKVERGEGIDMGALDTTLGRGVGQFASFIRPSFEGCDLDLPLLRGFITTVLYSFGKHCEPRKWLNSIDFVEGAKRGLKEGASFAKRINNPSQPQSLVYIGIPVKPGACEIGESNGRGHASESSVLPMHRSTPEPPKAAPYPTPSSICKKDAESHREDTAALSDVFGSDADFLQQIKQEMDSDFGREASPCDVPAATSHNISRRAAKNMTAREGQEVERERELIDIARKTREYINSENENDQSLSDTETLDGAQIID